MGLALDSGLGRRVEEVGGWKRNAERGRRLEEDDPSAGSGGGVGALVGLCRALLVFNPLSQTPAPRELPR